jgi:hypothetical protein
MRNRPRRGTLTSRQEKIGALAHVFDAKVSTAETDRQTVDALDWIAQRS